MSQHKIQKGALPHQGLIQDAAYYWVLGERDPFGNQLVKSGAKDAINLFVFSNHNSQNVWQHQDAYVYCGIPTQQCTVGYPHIVMETVLPWTSLNRKNTWENMAAMEE